MKLATSLICHFFNYEKIMPIFFMCVFALRPLLFPLVRVEQEFKL